MDANTPPQGTEPQAAFSKASGTPRKSARPKKKRTWKRWAFLGFAVFFALFLWWGFQPITIQGSQLFGLCRTYVEMQVPYPTHLRFTAISERSGVVNIGYIYTDGFGEQLSTEASCIFKPDPQGQVRLDSFRIRKGAADRGFRFAAEDPEKVKAFNATLPFVAQAGPQLKIIGFPDDIKRYK